MNSNEKAPFLENKVSKSCFAFVIAFFFLSLSLFSQPVISSFAPTSGIIGTQVIISGSGFSPIPTNNFVFFGKVRATVSSATTTSLSVVVPSGATYEPVSVSVNNLTGFSAIPFTVTFSGAAPLFTPQSFKYVTHIDSVNSDIETTKYIVGDIDNDGKIDLITIDRLNNTMSIYRNTTTGGLISFAQKVDFVTGQNPRSVSVGDINGDGKPDIVVSNFNSHSVAVFRNTSTSGNISFAPKIDFNTASQPAGISITDLDGDGRVDLVVNTVNLTGYISILRNTGTGGTISFADKLDIQVVGGSIEEIKSADIDGDGKTDIILPNYNVNAVTILRNTSLNGNISFASPVNIGSLENPVSAAIGDLNNDGKPDMVVGHYLNYRSVLRLNVSTPGNIAFEYQGAVSGSNLAPTGLAISDLDGDSRPDVVINDGLQSFSLHKNVSTPGSAASFTFGTLIPATYSSDVTPADFDNDGKVDLAFNAGLYRVAIWINQTDKPFISSFLPLSGGKGDTITIRGSNFSGITSVSFGGIPALSFTVVDSATITAVVSSGASGIISLSGSRGAGSITGFTFIGAPVITSFNPVTAEPDSIIMITGLNFGGATAVSFGGTPALYYSILSPTLIKAVVWNGSTGSISVTTPYGTDEQKGFSYIAAPRIHSFSPIRAVTGSTVTIKGLNLAGTTAVSFGGIPATSFTIIDSGTISAVVSDQGLSGDIKLSNPYGTSSLPGFTYFPPPVITSFSPSEAAKGDTVIISGHNFQVSYPGFYITAVKFGGSEASSFSVIDTTTILARVGWGASGAITLECNRGNASINGFTFVPEPVISSVYPRLIGPGSEITITGKNLSGTMSVSLGGVPAASFVVVSADTIKAIAGEGGSGYLSIQTPHHTKGGAVLEYTTNPYIHNISPNSGPVGSLVTINGVNFQPGASDNIVYFGGVKTYVIAATANKITVPVPAGAGYKPVSVVSRITGLSATSRENFSITFPVDPAAFDDSSFVDVMDLTTGSKPYYIKYEDLDGDGKPDIIVNNQGSTFISIYRNISEPGNINFSKRIDIDLGFITKAFAIADMDGDGKLDLLVSNDGGVPKIVILKNQSSSGNIVFNNSYTIGGLFHNAGFIETGDFNFDGKPDIVFLCTACQVSSGKIPCYISTNTSSDGNLSFEGPRVNTVSTPVPAGLPSGLIVTDFDNNGKPDIIMGTSSIGGGSYLPNVYLLKNITSIGKWIQFTSSGVEDDWYYYKYSIPYLAPFGSHDYPGYVVNRYIYRNTNGTFSLALQTSVMALGVYDLNGDGKLDIIGDDFSKGNLSILKNIGDQSKLEFAVPYQTTYGSSGGLLEIGDLDGDSKPDIAITYPALNIIKVLRNRMNETSLSPPVIQSFSPQRAAFSNQVLIKGSNFNQVTSVSFGGTPALYFTVLSQDSILAAVGNGASGKIIVNTLGGKDSANGFTFIPAPVVTSFTPKTGIEGTSVTITGNDFDSVSAVYFGGVPASSFIVNSGTSITAIVGKGASGNVSVSAQGGTAQLNGFTYYPVPAINTFSPAVAASGVTVTIHGTGFTGATSVSFGGIPALWYTVIDSATITAAADNGASGNITVTTPGGMATTAGFTFIPPPFITSFSPAIAGQGATITITGKNLNNTTAVNFGGMPAISFSVVDSLTVQAVIGEGTTGDISITTFGGSATLPGFTFVPVPIIQAFNPAKGQTGTVVTIKGKNFKTATSVTFGGTAAKSFVIENDNTISAIVDSGSSGKVQVITVGGSTSLPGFIYFPPVEKKITVFPNPAHDILYIHHPLSQHPSVLELINARGYIVKSSLVSTNTSFSEMNVRSLLPGIYILVWKDGDRRLSERVIIH